MGYFLYVFSMSKLKVKLRNTIGDIYTQIKVIQSKPTVTMSVEQSNKILVQ